MKVSPIPDVVPHILIRWLDGLDKPPTLYLLADSDKQEKQMREILTRLFVGVEHAN